MRRFAVNLSIWRSRNLRGARAHLQNVNQEVAEDEMRCQKLFNGEPAKWPSMEPKERRESGEDERAAEKNDERGVHQLEQNGHSSRSKEVTCHTHRSKGCTTQSLTPSSCTVGAHARIEQERNKARSVPRGARDPPFQKPNLKRQATPERS